MNKLGPSAVDIQNHLYTSFLEGSTADVALRVHGSWDAIYKLHRVVLIQSGFFRSLFTAGFAESSSRSGSNNGADEIVIHFDDGNITRAAFEICISRLYGGGPPLDIAPPLIPSLLHPLTPSFPNKPPSHVVPTGHHPATPRFLMSLLATAVYLSIPSLASQALSSILSTVGPHTVLKYLDFAIGKQIGPLDHDSGEPDAAVGLEAVAKMVEYDMTSVADTASIRDISPTFGNPSDRHTATSSTSYGSFEDETEGMAKSPLYHYGPISNKIGEACACWLARWGVDLLPYEEKSREAFLQKEWSLSANSRNRSKTVPSGSPSPDIAAQTKYDEQQRIPLIWSRGGLNAIWVAAVISADTFFIKGERERYDFACRVIELRRKGGILVSEEKEWATLFSHGIYYANMTMDDLIYISWDISPTTNQPFVPLTVIQAAHWTQSILRHHITVRPVSSPSLSPSRSVPSPPPRDKELGITQTSADILMDAPPTVGTFDHKFYFPVTGNSSIRVGDNGSNFNGTGDGGSLSMDQLFSSSSSLSPPPPLSPTLKPSIISANAGVPTSEADFFGLRSQKFSASSTVVTSDTLGKTQWSPYPPCRFAVEFWDLESLKEKSRLYSQTIWYAGSLFNIYVQVVRKKGQVQLGIYLHRQSSIEPIPPASTPSSLTTVRTESHPTTSPRVVSPRPPHSRGPSLPILPSPLTQNASHYSPSIYPSSRSSTPLSSANFVIPSPSVSTSYSLPTPLSASTTSPVILPATSVPLTPPQPYRDPRPSISAHFMISCASATGSSQTRFTSSPDVFTVSQSWGWKSSSLRTEEFMDVRMEGASLAHESKHKISASLRATIVLGLV